jgi:SAM-dependent methyltransferase
MTCFDAYANDYEAALNRGLAVSGESKDFFAIGRVSLLNTYLKEMNLPVRTVLDFGCGTGTSTPLFFDILGAEKVIGVDPSESSLSVAREEYQHLPATFHRMDEYRPEGNIDVAFCNGVFHHIPLDARPASVRYIANSLRAGGVFDMWENNPWSPAARYVMSRIPFDSDAIMLWPGETRRLIQSVGLQVVRTDFAFVFPRKLRALRPIEALLQRFPLGAQYQVLSQKPSAPGSGVQAGNS